MVTEKEKKGHASTILTFEEFSDILENCLENASNRPELQNGKTTLDLIEMGMDKLIEEDPDLLKS